jgi:hypothetical protein
MAASARGDLLANGGQLGLVLVVERLAHRDDLLPSSRLDLFLDLFAERTRYWMYVNAG